jgi:hypothetical protein
MHCGPVQPSISHGRGHSYAQGPVVVGLGNDCHRWHRPGNILVQKEHSCAVVQNAKLTSTSPHVKTSQTSTCRWSDLWGPCLSAQTSGSRCTTHSWDPGHLSWLAAGQPPYSTCLLCCFVFGLAFPNYLKAHPEQDHGPHSPLTAICYRVYDLPEVVLVRPWLVTLKMKKQKINIDEAKRIMLITVLYQSPLDPKVLYILFLIISKE